MQMPTLVQVSEYLETMMNSLKTTYSIDNVYYGDQTKLAGARCVCIEPNTKINAEYRGSQRLVMPEYSVFILVYQLNFADTQFNRKESDTVAEALESEIHKDQYLGGLVIDSYVTSVESGYKIVDRSLARVTRLTVKATGRGILGV